MNRTPGRIAFVCVLAAASAAAVAAERPTCRAAIAWQGATVTGQARGCRLRDVLGELARHGGLEFSGRRAALDTVVSVRFRDETLEEALGRLLESFDHYSAGDEGVKRLVVTGLHGPPPTLDPGAGRAQRRTAAASRAELGELPRWRVRQGERTVEVVAGPGTTITPEELALFDLGDDVHPSAEQWGDFYPEQPAGTELTGPPAADGRAPVDLLSMDPDPYARLPEPEQQLAPEELRRLENSIANFVPVYSETGPARYEPPELASGR